MNGLHKKHLLIIIAALFTMLFSSCQSAQPVAAGSAEKLHELGDVIVMDLQTKILPNLKTPENLVDYGYVLSANDESYGIDAIAEFFVSYEGRNDSEVTIVFAESSFVVARVTFIAGAGYYLRYEYDKNNPEEISIRGQLIDKVDLKYQANPPKWDMTLKLKNKQIAKFVLKNPVKRDNRLRPIQ